MNRLEIIIKYLAARLPAYEELIRECGQEAADAKLDNMLDDLKDLTQDDVGT